MISGNVIPMVAHNGVTIEASHTPRKNRNRCVLMGLGAAEVALGSFCVIMGAIVAGHEASHFNCYIFGFDGQEPMKGESTTGEGIWCGVWIIVAGALGVAAGKKRSSSTIINLHMAFAIGGSIFAAVLFSIACNVVSLANDNKPFFIGIMSTIAVVAFASTVLQIVSASYCCCADKDDGCGHCCGEDPRVDRTPYFSNPPMPGQTYYVTLPGQTINNQLLVAQQSSPLPVVTSPLVTMLRDGEKPHPGNYSASGGAANGQPPAYSPA